MLRVGEEVRRALDLLKIYPPVLMKPIIDNVKDGPEAKLFLDWKNPRGRNKQEKCFFLAPFPSSLAIRPNARKSIDFAAFPPNGSYPWKSIENKGDIRTTKGEALRDPVQESIKCACAKGGLHCRCCFCRDGCCSASHLPSSSL